MSTTSTLLLLGIAGAAGYWLFLRRGYYVSHRGGYEYFDALGDARAYAKEHPGSKLYEIRAGAEFDERDVKAGRAKQLTPNRRRRRKAA
jgi:hypothetical protein